MLSKTTNWTKFFKHHE